ncbi:MAG: cation-translocating P-type ATPase, partial [Clostridia bacterium]|nr:cation-translocating P-type ATPase [Clostridia bacterium]
MKKQQAVDTLQVQRFAPDVHVGLSQQQVNERKAQNLTNKVERTVDKSYTSIFIDNVFTFFNMLGLSIMVLMFVLGSFGNLFFSVVILANTAIGIIQEIKAKKSIEKLSIMSAPTAKVLRDGIECEVSVGDVVLDDVIRFEAGKQIIADCEVVDGEIEVNEALLTGESIAIKKRKGDTLLS